MFMRPRHAISRLYRACRHVISSVDLFFTLLLMLTTELNSICQEASESSVVSHAVCTLSKTALVVIPAKAGIQKSSNSLDSGSR